MEKEPGDAVADGGYLGSAFGEVWEECGVNSAGLGLGCCVVLDLGYAAAEESDQFEFVHICFVLRRAS